MLSLDYKKQVQFYAGHVKNKNSPQAEAKFPGSYKV